MKLIGLFSAIFYLIFYIIASFLFFGLLLNTQLVFYSKTWGLQFVQLLYISDLKGVFLKEKNLGLILIIIFLLFSGLPPFISFFGKFWIYIILFLEGNYFTLFLVFFLSLISTFYYLWWIRCFLFDFSLTHYSINNYYSIFTLKNKNIFSNKYLIQNFSFIQFFNYMLFFYQVLILFIIISPFYIFYYDATIFHIIFTITKIILWL